MMIRPIAPKLAALVPAKQTPAAEPDKQELIPAQSGAVAVRIPSSVRFGNLIRYMTGGQEAIPNVRPKTTTLLDNVMLQLMMPQAAGTAGPSGKRGVVADPIARQLLKNNIIQISGQVSPEMADQVYQQVLLLVSAMVKLKKRKPIKLIVNSPGGYIIGMHGIMNAMKLAQNTKIKEEGEAEAKPIVVETHCLAGFAASAASVIMALGTPGHRYVGEFAEIMIHQPLGGAQGQETEIRQSANRITQMRQQLVDVFYETTKIKDMVRAENPDKSDEEIKELSMKRLHKMIERDNWLSSQKCVELGFADKIADHFPDITIASDELGDFTASAEPEKK